MPFFLFTVHLIDRAWERNRDNVFLTGEVKYESTSEQIGVTEILSTYEGMKKIGIYLLWTHSLTKDYLDKDCKLQCAFRKMLYNARIKRDRYRMEDNIILLNEK